MAHKRGQDRKVDVVKTLLGALVSISTLVGCIPMDAYRLAALEILETTPDDPVGKNVYYCWDPEGGTGEPDCIPGAADAALGACIDQLRHGPMVANGKLEARREIIACMNAKHWDHVRIEVME